MSAPDGGPAFPRAQAEGWPGDYVQHGMSTRTWLAGQALAGLLASGDRDGVGYVAVACEARDIADATLRALGLVEAD